MSTRMLIDSAHPEETRVAVVHSNRIEEFDFESASKASLRGNIYLARVTRVEPSLQAAFVEYGGNRHGFLAFTEIHPDYYQIPVEDRRALLAEQAAHEASRHDEYGEDDEKGREDGAEIEEVGADDAFDDAVEVRRSPIQRRYKIQEVIKRRQILLVQVVKEERGTKGAALTTYLSLAGRYCVLMPNTARGGGISRKIPSQTDRKRLKSVLSELDVPEGMGCIIRTAGASRTKAEVKRDYSYLIRLWSNIRDLTLKSIAPALIYEEGNLVKRAIRDMYFGEIDEVLVEGAEGYKVGKEFMKLLMPSHAKKVKQYKDPIPLFHRFQVESQLETMYSATVPLKSGGYLVINPTEALVSIDVNSGKSTRERNIERTAYRTNLEAAEEVARQLRLRDLAGLIVIDFIDMEESRNNRGVERKLKDSLKTDRARLQVGRISSFGLLEMSRQRLRPGLLESSTVVCPVCAGAGSIRSVESSALQIMRVIEEEGIKGRARTIHVTVPLEVALYILNNKRHDLGAIEERFNLSVQIAGDASMHRPHYVLRREGQQEIENEPRVITQDNFLVAEDETDNEPVVEEAEEEEEEPVAAEEPRREGRGRRRGRGRDRQRPEAKPAPQPEPAAEDAETEEAAEEQQQPAVAAEGGEEQRSKRRRGRRGGRRRRKQRTEEQAAAEAGDDFEESHDDEAELPEETGDGEAEPAVVTAEWDAEPQATPVEAEAVPETAEPIVEPPAPDEQFVAPTPIEVEPELAAPVEEVAAEQPSQPEAPAAAEPEPELASEAAAEQSDSAESADARPDEPAPALEEAGAEASGGGEKPEKKRPRRQGWWSRAMSN
ncbi:MAG: Rne/Rng family ribonuclease [Alphaproteobacteria bacterium]|nr:Rne/Rng family ribonuclease [Alphaproteobacteria bacterium]